MDLSVRPLAAEDFDGFINYWLGLSKAEIERLGIAIDRLPSAARMRCDLEAMLVAPDDGVRSFVLAWCINGEAIGHSSLKDIVPVTLAAFICTCGARICAAKDTARIFFVW